MSEKAPHWAVKHGGYATRLHNIWKGAKARCRQTTGKQWQDYGGRGITFPVEWDAFEDFRHWALANGYEDNLSLERVDNDLGYSPENCVWADRKTQSRNRRDVRKTPDGVPWVDIYEANGLDRHIFCARLKQGWPIEKAATHPRRLRSNTNARYLSSAQDRLAGS